MSAKYPDLADVEKRVRSEVNAYIDSISILPSFRTYLKNLGIKCYIERKINKKFGGFKTPDLIVYSNNFLIIDHKFTTSDSTINLSSKVEEMATYDADYLWIEKTDGKPIEFKPEIVMLTPNEEIQNFKKILSCPITWGYELEEEISIEQGIGSVKDGEVLKLFDPIFTFPISEEAAKYQFIISHPPLPYTAWRVYMILWTCLSGHDARYHSPQFKVGYDVILTTFNHLFPPWISAEIKQMNDTRLKEALVFLDKLHLVDWIKPEKQIIVDRNKGRLIADLLTYLSDQYVRREHAKEVKAYEIEVLDEKKDKSGTQKSLTDF